MMGKDNLLGHPALLQVVDDEELPGHSPSPNGAGSVQVRVLVFVPPPHDTEQAP